MTAIHGSAMILVAEDKEGVRLIIQTVLERSGYRTLMAKDGIEAADLWNKHKSEIKLLFTDVVMPGGVTGKDLADHLRAERSNLKVVFCSGYSAQIIGPDIANSPGSYFLAKPFDVRNLMQVVDEALAAN
jgi:two-component system, cell cycle sensor histidine kinase and response regulator CckA